MEISTIDFRTHSPTVGCGGLSQWQSDGLIPVAGGSARAIRSACLLLCHSPERASRTAESAGPVERGQYVTVTYCYWRFPNRSRAQESMTASVIE